MQEGKASARIGNRELIMEYFIGERLCCESTRPNTYITPVFERVDGDKLRIHHIEAGALGDGIKFVPLRHVSKKRRRVFDLKDENARLRHHLLSIMRGMRDAWCAEHDSLTCKGCPMHRDENTCGWTDAYDLIKELGLLDALYE